MLARFQDQLVEVLRKLDVNDPFGPLLCLAVLAKFSARYDCQMREVDPPQDLLLAGDAVLIEPKDNFFPARRYFKGKKAPTTLNLAVFRVINACSTNSGLTLGGALETLRLSEEVVNAFCSEDKKAWIAKNIGRPKKLYEKILRPDINSRLQCAVRRFEHASIKCILI